MDDFSQATLETGKEILKDTTETVGEQLGTKKEKGYTQNAKEQFNFWGEFRKQLLGNKTEEQLQKEGMMAKNSEIGEKQKIAFARERLKEMNASTSRQTNAYEYRGPEVPAQQNNSTKPFESHGPQAPQQPTPSSLDYAKQGSNEMMKKMVG